MVEQEATKLLIFIKDCPKTGRLETARKSKRLTNAALSVVRERGVNRGSKVAKA
jgi:hypothetical protein